MTFEFLAVIVFLNAVATVALWRTAARKHVKLKKKFFASLLHSKPIVPKHQPPKTIGEGWGLASDEDHQFF
jgi:hypothetical protein